MVVSVQIALVVAAICDVVVRRIDGMIGAFPTGGDFPVSFCNPATIAARDDSDGRIVLLSTVDSVGKMVVRCNAVELRGRLVVVACPVFSTIYGDLTSAVIGNDHSFVVVGVNP